MEFTKIEESIIHSINKQAVNLSAHPELHFQRVTDCYKETLRLQILALSGKLDTTKALELFEEYDKLFNNK